MKPRNTTRKPKYVIVWYPNQGDPHIIPPRIKYTSKTRVMVAALTKLNKKRFVLDWLRDNTDITPEQEMKIGGMVRIKQAK